MANLWEYLCGMGKLDFSCSLSLGYFVVLSIAAFVHVVPKTSVEKLGELFVRLPVLIQGAAYAGMIVLFCGVTLDAPSFI